jgi:hypothetical protein
MAFNQFTEQDAQAFRTQISSLPAKKHTHRSHLHTLVDGTAILGPWIPEIKGVDYESYQAEVRRPILAFRQDAASFSKWQKHHSPVRLGFWATPSEKEIAW